MPPSRQDKRKISKATGQAEKRARLEKEGPSKGGCVNLGPDMRTEEPEEKPSEASAAKGVAMNSNSRGAFLIQKWVEDHVQSEYPAIDAEAARTARALRHPPETPRKILPPMPCQRGLLGVEHVPDSCGEEEMSDLGLSPPRPVHPSGAHAPTRHLRLWASSGRSRPSPRRQTRRRNPRRALLAAAHGPEPVM